MSTTSTSARIGLAGGALALALTLSACGGDTAPQAATSPAGGAPSPTAQAGASAEHNEADIRFGQTMIPHHRQAVEMAELAADRAENPDVAALAERIREAQAPEIETISGYLEAWGAEAPAEGGMADMGHSGMSGMSGMTTPEQMDQMGRASGAAFDTMFLENMIAHHEGAVTDAQRELTEGVNPQAKDLAGRIIAAQTAEMDQMEQMLQAN
jgi:uncharacterized protein (DUF305 family)